MAAALAGPAGITLAQAGRIAFTTTTSDELIISRCLVCKAVLMSDARMGQRTQHHNSVKAQHRDDHYWGRYANEGVA